MIRVWSYIDWRPNRAHMVCRRVAVDDDGLEQFALDFIAVQFVRDELE